MKIRMPITYVCFVMGALLVGGLALIEVPCPLDEGTGVITGAKDLKVTEAEGELVDQRYLKLGCGEYWTDFTYEVTILVVNNLKTPIYGAIVVKFYDPETTFVKVLIYPTSGPVEETLQIRGDLITGIPIFVEIPAETAETIEEIVVFTGEYLLNAGETHKILADVSGEIVCPYCDGTGKVPITEWLRIKANVQ